MDSPRSHTLKNDAPAFLCSPANLDGHWSKVVNARGVKWWLLDPKACRRKIPHLRDTWSGSPLLGVKALTLLFSDSLSITQDPEFSAYLCMNTLWSIVQELLVKVLV